MAQHGHRPFWRKKFYVHAIQRKYFFLSLVPLVVCGFLLAFLVLFPLHLTLWGTATDPEKAATLEKVSAIVGVRIWLAIIISMITSGLLSYFVTNKFAGPLYRIEQILREVTDGNLPTTVRIRRDDDLQDFVGLFDRAFRTISSAMTAVTKHQAQSAKELAELHRKIKAGLNGEILQDLEEIGRNFKNVGNILANLGSTLRAPNPGPTKE
jgi:methyl-accepting chemotaxis protein